MSAVLQNQSPKEWTAEEFFNSPYSQGFELVKGKIVPKGCEINPEMPAGALRGYITNRLNKLLSIFVDDNNLGATFAAETGFKLSEKGMHGVDAAFVSNEKLAQFGIPENFFPAAPDLAVEVISPNNSVDEIQEKIEEYLLAGTKLVWIVYPKQKMIQVYRSSNVINVLREADALDGEEVLPGFQLPLSELFGSLPQIKE
jgi:Uma2 family endonuclease